jgi:hypothetical protein
MSEPDDRDVRENQARTSAFDDVRKLLTTRIRELESERAQRSKRPMTIGDGIELLGNLERTEELRDVDDRIMQLRDADPDATRVRTKEVPR